MNYDPRYALHYSLIECKLTDEPNDEQFAQEQEEICHFVQDSHPGGASQRNTEQMRG